jgi:hypothetical protein
MAARAVGGKHVSGSLGEKGENVRAMVGIPNAVRRKIAVETAQCIIIHNDIIRIFARDERL